MTGLMLACQKGDLNMTRALLLWGANPNRHSFGLMGEHFIPSYRKTALMFAAENMNSELIELLGDYGARLWSVDYDLVLEEIRRQWTHWVDINRALDNPSAHRVSNDEYNEARAEWVTLPSTTRGNFKESYAVVHYCYKYFDNPPPAPVLQDSEVALLLDRFVVSGSCAQPLLDQCYYCAKFNRAVDLASIVKNEDVDRLDSLCKQERYREIINVKSCVVPGPFGWEAMTPLMSASEQGFSEIIVVLLDSGANPNLFVDGGYRSSGPSDNTPLMLAARAGYIQIVDALLSAGAIVDTQTYHGYTALMHAAHAGQAPVVARLLEAGANSSLKTRCAHHYDRGPWRTALDLARENQHIRCIDILDRWG
jgi:ankyrin repeat protein